MGTTRHDFSRRVTNCIAPDPDGRGPIDFADIRDIYDVRFRPSKVEIGELAVWQSQDIASEDRTGFTVYHSVETIHDEVGRNMRNTVKIGTTAESVAQYRYTAIGELDCTSTRMNIASLPTTLPGACISIAEPAQNAFDLDRITREIDRMSSGRMERLDRGSQFGCSASARSGQCGLHGQGQMMRTDLDHLPAAKQREIERAVLFVFGEFDGTSIPVISARNRIA